MRNILYIANENNYNQLTYDQLGQLIIKKVGGSANNATDRWQEINYKYNIRGWLTRINDIGLVMAGKGLPPPSPSDDLFSFAIQYNHLIEPGSGDYTSPLYNGNIAQTFWKTGSDNTLRGYNYEYDQLNRLLNASFYKKGTSPYSGAYKESLAYDLNGNITSLYRTTADASNNAIHMDELTYAYENDNGNSNLLLNVSDAVSNQNTGGFVDGNTSLSLDDYEYDVNGNMILDRNKGIESIAYNHLNLPVKVTWSNKKYITYQYTAAGQKVKKTVRDNDSIKIVDYLDGFQYTGNVLQFFPHAEGYVKVSPNQAHSLNMFNYVFNYTDHLGNVRLSYSKDPQTGTLDILDENHYYPFGLKHGVYTAATLKDFRIDEMGTNGGIGGGVGEVALINVTKTEYQYKYNGFEYQDELDLNWYDYGARNYDATIGRFFNSDRFSEKYYDKTPYQYAGNNPVRFVDVKGDSIWITHNWNEKSKTHEWTINMTGKVLDLTQKTSKQAKAYAKTLTNMLENSIKGEGKVGGVNYKFNANIKLSHARDMDDVKNNDHLLVIVDNIGQNADGVALVGGKTAYVEEGWFTGPNASTGVHEFGHLFGLGHNWEDGISDSNRVGNHMSYESNTNHFSFGQLNHILNNKHKLNQGSNSQKAPYSQKNYIWHTSSPSEPWLMNVKKGDIIPTIINGY